MSRIDYEPEVFGIQESFKYMLQLSNVFLASELFCCLLETPFEEKPFAFLLYISFEESISYRVYSRVNNL